MAFKNPSLITNGITKEEFEDLKSQVQKNTIDIEQIKNNKNSEIINNVQEYTLKSEIPTSAFLTSIPRMLEIDMMPKQITKELANQNDDLDADIIPISSLYNENEKNYVLLNSIPTLAQVNGGQRTITITNNPVQVLSKVQA